MNINDKKRNKVLYDELISLTDKLIAEAEELKSKDINISGGIEKLGTALYDEITKDSGKAVSVGISLDRSRFFKTSDNNNIFNNEMLKTALLLILNSSLPAGSGKTPADDVLINGIRQSIAGSVNESELNDIDIRSLISYDSYTSYDSFISDIKALSDMIKRIQKINYPEYSHKTDIQLTEEEEERIQKVSSSALMLNTLYKDTLLENAADRSINVLVIGSDKYCSEFISNSLMAGQVPGYTLTVTSVCADSGSYMKKYMEDKPALSDFVKIIKGKDVCNPDIEDEYAVLRFSQHDCVNKLHSDTSLTSTILNRIYAKRILENAKNGAYTYIFISLGNDVLNYCAAAAFHKEAPGMTVNYICTTGFVKAAGVGLNPVPIDDVRIDGLEAIDKELNRIAFNIHKVWSRNDDVDRVRKQYLSDDYCRNSAMTFAVSVKYKLKAIGIDFEDAQKAAADFAELIRRNTKTKPQPQTANKKYNSRAGKDPRSLSVNTINKAIAESETEKLRSSDILNSPIARDMAFSEHKRWVLEKVTNGWTALPPSEFESFLRDKNTEKDTDPEKPRHSCIVRCDNKYPLTELEPEKWDTLTDLNGFDELDKVSLLMHRAAAGIDRKNEILTALKKLENIFSGLEQSREAGNDSSVISKECTSPKYIFNSFRYAVQQIMNGSRNYGYRFDEIFDDISAYKISDEQKNSLRTEQLDIIRKALYPKAFANKLYDYKINDILFIENIPQVLGCPEHISLMTAFDDARYSGGTDAVFANAASALVLQPEEIVYLYNFDNASDPAELESRITNVVRLLQRKHIPAAKQPEGKPVSGISFIILSSIEKVAASAVCRSLGAFEQGNANIMKVCGINIKIAVTTRKNDFYSIIRAYAADTLFDGSAPLFSSSMEQGEFMYDVIKSCDFRYFEFDPRKESFENIRNCDFLRYLKRTAYLKAEDVFALSNAYLVHYEKDGKYVSQGSLSDCSQSYNKFWNYCIYGKSGRRTEDFSEINNFNTQEWNEIISAYANKFPSNSLSAKNIKMEYNEDAELFKAFTEDPEHPERNTGKTSKDGVLVKNFTYDAQNHQMSLTFTDEQAKNILTKSGEVLELFCYHEVMKTGYFDDVVSGYEFKKNGIKNELDLMLTKGTKTLIVECKLQSKLEADYYYKLDSIAKDIGINCTCVIVGYAYKDQFNRHTNDLHRNRGRQLDIITVSSLREINNIGQVLIDIMEGQYQPKAETNTSASPKNK